MPVLLFPDVAYFLVKAFVHTKNPQTGRVNYYEAGVKWWRCDLRDPVQREHAHNYYLTLCPSISQADRDKVASEWADIRHAREAEEARVKKMVEEARAKKMVEEARAKKLAEVRDRNVAMYVAEQKKKKAEEEEEEAKEKAVVMGERKRKVAAMLDESEGVAWNIAKAEKKLKIAADEQKARDWMGVVMRP